MWRLFHFLTFWLTNAIFPHWYSWLQTSTHFVHLCPHKLFQLDIALVHWLSHFCKYSLIINSDLHPSIEVWNFVVWVCAFLLICSWWGKWYHFMGIQFDRWYFGSDIKFLFCKVMALRKWGILDHLIWPVRRYILTPKVSISKV